MNSKLLSIVIPVFKVEKYIVRCLDSLILPNELMEQVEVIIVNDGTPDRSAEMAREYEKKYPQSFRVIDKENGGHGSAWNRGLKEATGKYLRFLDSDDWLSNLEVFLTELERVEDDMVYTNVSRFYEDVDKTVVDRINNTLEYNKSYEFEIVNLKRIPFGFWNWTYKTELLQKEEPLFVEHVYYDDAILFYAPIMLSKSFRAFDLVLYNYRLGRPGQTTNKSVQKKHAVDYFHVSMAIIDFVSPLIDRVSLPKQLFIKESLSHYIVSCFNRLLWLDYNVFKEVMKEWRHKLKESKDAYTNVGNRLKAYQSFPCFLSYVILKYYALLRDK